jgi:hypothetical protein
MGKFSSNAHLALTVGNRYRILHITKRNQMAKKATNKKTNGFEQNLWDTANNLRGSV